MKPTLSMVNAPPAPVAGGEIDQWCLDPSISFLNHGSFGARARPVFMAQQARRLRFEARPIQVLERERDPALEEARCCVGNLVGAAPEQLGFVTNATGGVNAVLRSIEIKPGDELLTTTHVYNAVRNTMRHIADAHGATYSEVDIPLPLSGPEVIVERIRQALSPRTRLLVIDHVTSPTAIVFPVEQIIEAARRFDVDVLVDGAHAPGMFPLNINELGPAYYTGNLHKWVGAPPGAAFLWVRADRVDGVHPNTISHFLGDSFAKEFSWQGTRDITPWLTTVDAVRFLNELGIDRVMRHNHELATWAHEMLTSAWGVEPITPLDGSMLGSMATIALPEAVRGLPNTDALQRLLYDAFGIEVVVDDWSGEWWCRVSCQVYNRPEQYEAIAEAILEVGAAGGRA